ncbi:MAG: Hsp70 family protein [Acidobacteriia bacterium]|nr:Hsp70 family protein [Terriglobia bacterium]
MIAIDFGTSNSSITVFSKNDTEPRLQPVAFGDSDSYDHNVMPSAVCTCKNSECQAKPEVYGHDAIRHQFDLTHDSTLLQEMKLYFDESTLNAPTFAEKKQITTLREEGGFLTPVSKTYKYPRYAGDVPLKPNEFVPGTARLIHELIRLNKSGAEDRQEIVIGVPASFHDTGMRRLREAAKAGAFGEGGSYEGLYLYLEPVAAARSYMTIGKGNTLVLDYGGGTLDITVMTIGQQDMIDRPKIVISGFPEAGARMDQAILHYSLSRNAQIKEWYDAQPMQMRLRVKRNVERAKIALSTTDEATVELPGSGFDPLRLTTGDLSSALQAIITRMVAKVSQTVTKAVEGIENIDFVVLSGGTSLNRVVQIAVQAMFQHIPIERFVLPDPTKPEDVERCLCAVVRGLAWLRHDGYTPIELPLPQGT